MINSSTQDLSFDKSTTGAFINEPAIKVGWS
jgi:hypothetical protein